MKIDFSFLMGVIFFTEISFCFGSIENAAREVVQKVHSEFGCSNIITPKEIVTQGEMFTVDLKKLLLQRQQLVEINLKKPAKDRNPSEMHFIGVNAIFRWDVKPDSFSIKRIKIVSQDTVEVYFENKWSRDIMNDVGILGGIAGKVIVIKENEEMRIDNILFKWLNDKKYSDRSLRDVIQSEIREFQNGGKESNGEM